MEYNKLDFITKTLLKINSENNSSKIHNKF